MQATNLARNGTRRVAVELSQPSPEGGVILQEMAIDVELTKPRQEAQSTKYYEAFLVPPGAVAPFPATDTLAVNPPMGTSGKASWRGSARFYEGLKLPPTFIKDSVREAGSLPASRIDPDLDTSTATPPVNVEFQTSWP